MQLFCRSVITARRLYNLAKQPWSRTIINLASSTPPLPFRLNNSPLTFPPSCPPFLYQHNPWLTSLSPTTSSPCWVSNKLFSSPQWANRGGKYSSPNQQTALRLITLKCCFKDSWFGWTEPLFSEDRYDEYVPVSGSAEGQHQGLRGATRNIDSGYCLSNVRIYIMMYYCKLNILWLLDEL